MQKSFILISMLLFVSFAEDDLSLVLCPTCTCVGSDKTFNRGDTSILCVHFVQNLEGTLKAQRAAFPLTVDKFSAVGISGAFAKYAAESDTYNYSTYIIVQAHGGQMSYPIPFSTQMPNKFYANLFSIVINITDGVIGGVTWDNTCYCDAFSCSTISFKSLNDTDTEDYLCNAATDCASITENTTSCDPKIYVSWLGTDSRDQRMQSSGLRLSRFRTYSVSDIWAKANSLVPSTTARLLFSKDDKCFLEEKSDVDDK